MWLRQPTKTPKSCRPDQSGGLRVVQQHHVAGSQLRSQVGQVLLQHTLVVPPLRQTDRSAVTGGAMDEVVDPLGHGKEVVVAVQGQPPAVEARALPVGEQRGEDLATPPPWAVALMYTVAPSMAWRALATANRSRSARSPPIRG